MSDKESVNQMKKAGAGLSVEEQYLFELLRRSLTECVTPTESSQDELPKEIDWNKLIYMAKQHSVLSLLYNVLAEEERLAGEARKQLEQVAQSIVRQNYRLLFLSKHLVKELTKAKVPVAVLKGVATAGFFPTPELRKSGDVDLLLLDKSKQDVAKQIMEGMGAVEEPIQRSHHHVTYGIREGIELELHTMLAEPFDNEKMNRYMESLLADCRSHVQYQEVMGVSLPILTGAYHAYELLLHMLQHFLRSGFGLKLLCDWVAFWNGEQGSEEEKLYIRLVEESGVKGFSDMVTLACCQYMGLDEKKVEFMQLPTDYDVEGFVKEILEAEEFGRSSEERMVTLRGTSFMDYVREFHHQMHLNFPNAGKVFLFWPILWVVTLVRFLRNNRRVRGVSGMAVLKKAGQRSKFMEQMKLFK